MEIFVSEKEIYDNFLNYVEDDFVEEYWLSRGVSQGKGFEFCDDVGLVKIQSLEQHDAEVRNKVINELLEWADSKIMDWINSPNYREPQFRGTRIIHYCDLKQKLTELLTPNKKENMNDV